MRVMVTGASGFVGSHVYELLKSQGHEVIGTRFGTNCKLDEFKFMNLLGDSTHIIDFLQEFKPEILIHCAWNVKSNYRDSKENLNWLIKSIELLQNFYSFGGRKAITLGTCFEYGRTSQFVNEWSDKTSPETLYGQCKLSLFKTMTKYAGTYNLDYSHARLFYLYGPYENKSRIVPYLINSFLNGETAKCGDPYQVRDFLYIKDVALAIVAIMNSSIKGSINVASGDPITIKALSTLIAEKCNKSELPEFSNKQGSDPPVIMADTFMLNKMIEFYPKYTLNSGLDEYINYLKGN